MLKKLFMLFILFIASTCHANTYIACFTPQEDCTDLIVKSIDAATKTIYVQAYIVTSVPIEEALVAAKERGIDIQVILDKTQETTAAVYFIAHGIPVWLDTIPNIAHNKIMIIDNIVVITGSFNFTTAAQFHNTENVLIITDHALELLYYANFVDRKNLSTKVIKE